MWQDATTINDNQHFWKGFTEWWCYVISGNQHLASVKCQQQRWWFTRPGYIFNSSPWYRWPIEIDGLPINSMVIFHGTPLNNQMVTIFNQLKWEFQALRTWTWPVLLPRQVDSVPGHLLRCPYQLTGKQHYLSMYVVCIIHHCFHDSDIVEIWCCVCITDVIFNTFQCISYYHLCFSLFIIYIYNHIYMYIYTYTQ